MGVSSKEIRIASLLVLDTIFFFLELIVGYSVHSLALIADSFHMLNDIISLVIALWAVRVSQTQQPDANYTYGWKRAEILGALINAIFLIALCVSIFIEAVQRFFEPQEIVNPKLVLGVGVAGLFSNFIGLILFHEHGHSHSHGSASIDIRGQEVDKTHSHSHGHDSLDDINMTINDLLPETIVQKASQAMSPKLTAKNNENSPLLSTLDGDSAYGSHKHSQSHKHTHGNAEQDLELGGAESEHHSTGSLNMEGVFLHVLGDALGNVGVILSGFFIWKTDYSWRFYSDPIVSLLITIIIMASAIPLSTKASKILLQATPSYIDADLVKDQILNIKGILSVHDFHIWNLDESFSIASLHVEIECSQSEYMSIAKQIRNVFHKYNIHSATVQPEFVNSKTFGKDSMRRFSRLAGGGVSYDEEDETSNFTTNTGTEEDHTHVHSSSKTLNNSGARKGSEISFNGGYGTNTGDTRCIVDEVANCNADNCLN
ncbi:hypothetical protein QEN19_003591 [Hanseniaspora menglaensis]